MPRCWKVPALARAWQRTGEQHARTRVRTQLDPPDDERCEGYGGKEVSGELVIASSDATKVLEAPEHALDEVAQAIDKYVMRDERFAAADRRDYGLDPMLGQELAECVGVVGLVGNKPRQLTGTGEQSGCHSDIV